MAPIKKRFSAGDKAERLTLKEWGRGPGGKWGWWCECECGCPARVFAHESNILRGRAKSCGCLRKEKVARLKFRHGGCGTREYSIWSQMVRRCQDESLHFYRHYGGRGIRVCDQWLGEDGFVRFLTDMGPAPSAKHTLDRYPDNDGNYEPQNCRWATPKEQGRNTRRNRLLTRPSDGKTQCLSAWVEELGISVVGIMKRINAGKTGDALFAPPRSGKHKKETQ